MSSLCPCLATPPSSPQDLRPFGCSLLIFHMLLLQSVVPCIYRYYCFRYNAPNVQIALTWICLCLILIIINLPDNVSPMAPGFRLPCLFILAKNDAESELLRHLLFVPSICSPIGFPLITTSLFCRLFSNPYICTVFSFISMPWVSLAASTGLLEDLAPFIRWS